VKFILFALVIALMAVAGTFAYHNAQPISLHYVLGDIEMPLALFALLCFVVGALFTALLMVPHTLRYRQRIRRAKRAWREQERELQSLREMPLEGAVATES